MQLSCPTDAVCLVPEVLAKANAWAAPPVMQPAESPAKTTSVLVAELLQYVLKEDGSAGPFVSPVLDLRNRRELSILLTSVDLGQRKEREALAQRLVEIQAELQQETM